MINDTVIPKMYRRPDILHPCRFTARLDRGLDAIRGLTLAGVRQDPVPPSLLHNR
jgi:hypothetical protein